MKRDSQGSAICTQGRARVGLIAHERAARATMYQSMGDLDSALHMHLDQVTEQLVQTNGTG
jgi:hypothetical protein